MTWLLIALVSLAIPVPSVQPDVTEELMRLERVWNRAHEKGDVKAIEQVWADDIEIALPKMDRMSRAEALEFFRSGRVKVDHYETADLKVRVYGNAAVVTGDLMRSRSLLGVTTTDHWRFSKTYVRQGDRWRVVDFHASDAAK